MEEDPNVLPSATSSQPPPPPQGSGGASSSPPPPSQASWQPPQPPLHPSGISADERMWAMLGHLSSLTGYFTVLGLFLGPLIIWQMKKDSQPFAASQAREALNFNLSWFIYISILSVCAIVLLMIFIGALLFPVIGLMAIVMVVLTIIAGIKANEGVPYRYPLTIRFFS